jgi:hypothetical protein
MELVIAIAFVVTLGIFVGVGLAIGASAEGPDPGPPLQSPRSTRVTRAALLAIAAFLAILGAEAAAVGAWLEDPSTGRAEALIFLLEGLVDLGLIVLVLRPAWTLRRLWVVRLVAVCWLVIGPPALVLTIGRGPLMSFYLGVGPDMWAIFSVVVGAALVWLASLGGGAAVGAAEPAAAVAPIRPRVVLGAIVLACLVAVSSWPMAQFAGLLTMGGCAPEWLVPSNPHYCVTANVSAGTLTVTGDTTLADGALIDVTLTSDEHPLVDRHAPQRVVVAGGKFKAEFDVSRDHPGPVTLTAAFSPVGQPSAVVMQLGVKGIAITGANAVDNGSQDGKDLGFGLLVTLHLQLV